MAGIDVDGGGRGVDAAVAVVGVVADAGIVAPVAGRDPGRAQHQVEIRRVGDARLAAARARRDVGLGPLDPDVPARRAAPPLTPRCGRPRVPMFRPLISCL